MAASVWLPKYAKSVEEETLKWLLKIFLQQEKKFVNLVIEGCNAKRACCFTDAFVELEAYQKNRSCEEPVSKRNGVLVTDMVDTDILEQFILSGVEAVPNIEPFRAILDFIHDRRRHELAIRKIMEKTGGSGLAVALSEHLFSQLLASKDYRIDCSSKHLLKKCACGCNADIKSGTTALGSRFTWHGRADVLLNQIIAVQILDEQVDASKIDSPLNTQDTNDSEQEDGEPAWKKLRPHSDGIISAVNAIEVNSKNGKDTLYDLHVLDRIVAEAVTNSFTQVYSQASLADLLIPTVATTSKYFTILLYDPVNDILLQDVLRFSIWEYPEDARLNLFSVVCLWLFFNFTTFVRKTSLWRNEIETVESEFHKILDLKLERYKKISTDNKTQTEILNDQEGSSYGEILDLSCQRIKRNREI